MSVATRMLESWTRMAIASEKMWNNARAKIDAGGQYKADDFVTDLATQVITMSDEVDRWWPEPVAQPGAVVFIATPRTTGNLSASLPAAAVIEATDLNPPAGGTGKYTVQATNKPDQGLVQFDVTASGGPTKNSYFGVAYFAPKPGAQKQFLATIVVLQS